MLRSTRQSLRYNPVSADFTTWVQYSPFHWHYALPQVMETPRSVNRAMSAPFSQPNFNRFRRVFIPLDMHPAFRHALDPYVRKLALNRDLPTVSAEIAVADFTKLGNLIDDDRSRRGWLAKVIEVCGIEKNFALAKPLWDAELSRHRGVPSESLTHAFLFAAAEGNSADLGALFDRCLKNEWNQTPSFDSALWSSLIKAAGIQGNGALVAKMLTEAFDVHADIERFDVTSVVYAINAIAYNTDEYNWLKQFLFKVEASKVLQIFKRYVAMRGSDAESLNPQLTDNDATFYHVHWHNSIRQPRQFSPRQLFYDYQPSASVSATHNPQDKLDDIIKNKIAKWKEEGLLPEDYQVEKNIKVHDPTDAFKAMLRSEWFKKFPIAAQRGKYANKIIVPGAQQV